MNALYKNRTILLEAMLICSWVSFRLSCYNSVLSLYRLRLIHASSSNVSYGCSRLQSWIFYKKPWFSSSFTKIRIIKKYPWICSSVILIMHYMPLRLYNNDKKHKYVLGFLCVIPYFLFKLRMLVGTWLQPLSRAMSCICSSFRSEISWKWCNYQVKVWRYLGWANPLVFLDSNNGSACTLAYLAKFDLVYYNGQDLRKSYIPIIV